MERGNPRTNAKRGFQAEAPQEKSIDAVMGADWAVVVKMLSEKKAERRA